MRSAAVFPTAAVRDIAALRGDSVQVLKRWHHARALKVSEVDESTRPHAAKTSRSE